MGIRFYCPNGHKLNVKAFQGGQRGVCPHCGVGVDIPLESTRLSSRQLRAQQRQGASRGVGSGSNDAAGRNTSLPGEVRKSNGEHIVVSGPTATSAPPLGNRFSPSIGLETNPLENFPSQSPGTPAGQNASQGATQGPGSVFAGGSGEEIAQSPRLPSGSPAAPGISDPLQEAPEVVWYVRPSSGGQYGPATRDIMRVWISEGRVAADSLVWREGWRDWQEAASVFPQLVAAEPNDAVPGLGRMIEEELAHPRSLTGSHRTGPHRRSKSGAWSNSGNALLIAIAAAIVIIVVVLIVMLRLGGRKDRAKVGVADPWQAIVAAG